MQTSSIALSKVLRHKDKKTSQKASPFFGGGGWSMIVTEGATDGVLSGVASGGGRFSDSIMRYYGGGPDKNPCTAQPVQVVFINLAKLRRTGGSTMRTATFNAANITRSSDDCHFETY
jgi:hypothetical protein